MERTDERYGQYVAILERSSSPRWGAPSHRHRAGGRARGARAAGRGTCPRGGGAASGSIIKNAKSVVVPHTGGLKGIEAAGGGHRGGARRAQPRGDRRRVADRHRKRSPRTWSARPSRWSAPHGARLRHRRARLRRGSRRALHAARSCASTSTSIRTSCARSATAMCCATARLPSGGGAAEG